MNGCGRADRSKGMRGAGAGFNGAPVREMDGNGVHLFCSVSIYIFISILSSSVPVCMPFWIYPWLYTL